MEIDPRYTQYPDSLRDVYVSASGADACRNINDKCTGRNCHAGNDERHGSHLACGTIRVRHVAIDHDIERNGRNIGERRCGA